MDSFLTDKRFSYAMSLFNSEEWYEAHDLFEEIWHETSGDERKILQAIIQIAVAQVHLENNNKDGALMLYGESLSRLKKYSSLDLPLNTYDLYKCIESRLIYLQAGKDPSSSRPPRLVLEG